MHLCNACMKLRNSSHNDGSIKISSWIHENFVDRWMLENEAKAKRFQPMLICLGFYAISTVLKKFSYSTVTVQESMFPGLFFNQYFIILTLAPTHFKLRRLTILFEKLFLCPRIDRSGAYSFLVCPFVCLQKLIHCPYLLIGKS